MDIFSKSLLRISTVSAGSDPSCIIDSEMKCCQQKLVGDSLYDLVGFEDTSMFDCVDGCTYHRVGDSDPQQLYCFKQGGFRSVCQSSPANDGIAFQSCSLNPYKLP